MRRRRRIGVGWGSQRRFEGMEGRLTQVEIIEMRRAVRA